MIKVAIDGKNLARYSGGIAEYIKPLIIAWISSRPEITFVLIAPQFDSSEFEKLSNCKISQIRWPSFLPRFLRHPIYDNILLPWAIKKLDPIFMFSPYHDVRLSKKIPSVMMIHDTCIGDLAGFYPFKIRAYYEYMLRSNLSKCKRIITVSESSRVSIRKRYNIHPDLISIVPNSLPISFRGKLSYESEVVEKIRNNFTGQMRLFYTGGSDYRKNIRHLILSLEALELMGIDVHLWVTGSLNDGWLRAGAGIKIATMSRIHFLGHLSHQDLRAHYLAADVIVYPSFCEGFGRVCLESMSLGVPLACSDIPVFREVAGNYPEFFDPLSVTEMALAILSASRKPQKQPKIDPRFKEDAVIKKFIDIMNAELNNALLI